MISKKKPDLQNIGNAGEYYIASILSARGYTATVTLGRAEKYDILAVNQKTGKTIKIQVKAGWYRKNNTWRLSDKCENLKLDDFFYAFVNLNELKEPIEYWIISSELVARTIKERHKLWLNTLGKQNQKHNDNTGRSFTIKKDKYSPPWLNFEDLEKGKNSLYWLEHNFKLNEVL